MRIIKLPQRQTKVIRKMKHTWANVTTVQEHKYTCGYCGALVASTEGYGIYLYPTSDWEDRIIIPKVYICPNCESPTFFDDMDAQTPEVPYGEPITVNSHKTLESIYDEARRCFGVGGYTAVLLCCRVILMHIAVVLGADENKSYTAYIDYLVDNHHIPAKSKSWVDSIRELGNQANHEIRSTTREEARSVIKFTEMLLKITFEYGDLST